MLAVVKFPGTTLVSQKKGIGLGSAGLAVRSVRAVSAAAF